MNMTKADIEREVSTVVADFLRDQLGEGAGSVTAFLAGDCITVRATDCLSPAERQFVQEEANWRLFQEFKARQFDRAKRLLQEQLEELIACRILDIVSVVGSDGLRLEVITLSQDLEASVAEQSPAAGTTRPRP